MKTIQSLKEAQRALQIWRTLLSLLFFLWWDSRPWSYPGGFSQEKKVSRQRKRAIWITNELVNLGSAFIKLGQLLSARPDVLPAEWVVKLSDLQDKVPPFEFEVVEEILRSEITDLDKEIVFIEKKPLGAASLAQVHKATLVNGRKVVFKVQRPGLEKVFRLDLEVMQQVARIVQRNPNWSEGRDWIGIAKECKRVLLRELDFRIEAQYAARFKQQFLNDQNIKIPSVIWELSTKRVICLEYLPGIKINDPESLRKHGISPSSIAELGAQSYLTQLIEHGFFHADPHPGNLAVSTNGELIYYDFGMMGSISSRIRDRINSMIKAAAIGDAAEFVKELQITGLLSANAETGPVRRLVRIMLKEALTPPFSANVLERLSGDIYDLVYGKPFRIPVELIFVIRALSTFEGVGRKLDPNFNLISIAKPYLLPFMSSNNSNPNELINEIGRQFGEIGTKAVTLPKRIDQSLERLDQGDLQFQVRLGESDRHLRGMINAQQSVGQSILLGSLGITAAILGSTNKPSMALIPIIFAFPVGLGWLKIQLKIQKESKLDKIPKRNY